MTNEATAKLQRLTVAQLKARCQELGLVGVSKLNKANLVLRILDVTTCQSAAIPSAPDKQASTDGADVAHDHLTGGSQVPSGTTGSPQTVARKAKKKAAPQATTAEANSSKPTSKRDRESSETTSKTTTKRSKKSSSLTTTAKTSSSPSQLIQASSSSQTHPNDSSSLTPTHPTKSSPEANNGSTNNDVPKLSNSSSSHNRKVPKTTTAETPPTMTTMTLKFAPAAKSLVETATALPSLMSSTKPAVKPATKPAPRPAASSTTKSTTSAGTKKATISTSRPLSDLPKFTPLKTVTTVKPSAVKPTAKTAFPLVPLDDSPGTVENRVAHIKSHFLQRLFIRLNGTRNPPVLSPPFPAPYVCPSDWSTPLAFPGIHPKVFSTCSNDDFAVATRFWIARAHTLFQLGSAQNWSVQAAGLGLPGPDMSQWPPIMSCDKVTSEIHLVETEERALASAETLRTGASSTVRVQVRYLVVAHTGDIIASSRSSSDPSQAPERDSLIKGCQVRPDWHSYISGQLEGTIVSSLSAKVKTKDPADFPSGVNRAWAAKGTTTDAQFALAERVVLMSCMLNSFGGDKLDAMQMEAGWLNQGAAGGSSSRNAKSSIELYLPESHQVLSVHIPPPPFHPALAVVHRHSGKSEYVLRETGQVVGDEDEGVVELWQGLMGCDYKGNEKDTLDFWKGWEKRARGEEY